jgi:hypothetical protein
LVLSPTSSIYLGFITEGRLAAVLITPSLGVPNWSVIYINTTPSSLCSSTQLSGTFVSMNSSNIRENMILPKSDVFILLKNDGFDMEKMTINES